VYKSITVVLVPLLACCFTAMAADTFTLHVSPGGNDGWQGYRAELDATGTDGPLATLSGARDRLRALRASGELPADAPVQVLVHGGEYTITEPLIFEPQDSGTATGPVVYTAAPGEKPVLHGGRRIKEWRVENGVWAADVPEATSDSYTVGAFWVNGERRDAARYPKAAHTAGDYPAPSDFFYADGPVMEKKADSDEEVKSSTRFRFREGDVKQWEHLDEAVFVVFHSWATSLHRVKALDLQQRIVEFTGPARWHFTYWTNDQWYFVDHLLDALELPGEWCLSRKDGVLHYLPKPGETPETVDAVIPLVRQFILLQGRRRNPLSPISTSRAFPCVTAIGPSARRATVTGKPKPALKRRFRRSAPVIASLKAAKCRMSAVMACGCVKAPRTTVCSVAP